MDWVLDGIAIAARREATDRPLMEAERVDSALLLYEETVDRDEFPVPGEVLQLVVEDGRPVPPETLRRGVAFLRDQRARGRTVVVACAMGISRSVSFVVALLASDGYELEEALTAVMERRRSALPHPALLRSICECYGLGLTAQEIAMCVVRARKAARKSG